MQTKNKVDKMSMAEMKQYYERKALIMGALFAFLLLGIAFLGFFVGFNGVDWFK